MPKPLIIAHRGDSSRALENSLDAFRLALSIPVDMIEFDIRKSRDNVLYVMHDKETGRTADGSLDIEKAVSDDISRLRLKNGEAIPTLNDVFTLVDGKAGLNIEIKSKGAGALTAAHLIGSGYRGRVLLSSFKEEEIIRARRVMPDIPVAGIFDTFITAEVAAYKAKGYHFISLNRKTVTGELVDLCHRQNIVMYVWTVDDESDMEKLISWGVDGLYTNRPNLLSTIVEKFM
ncbi:MAG: glycerophosphodiester phosphodiesterase [Nitrospirae bacterium]|nr:glycerophosphodiester phosphodiesterase [Nitrospirota bacterium]